MKTLVLCCALMAAVAAQISPELPSTCASVSCIALAGVSCKEVLNPTSGIITGQCLSNVRPTGHDSVCGSAGQPLYVIQNGTAVQAFCGRGFNRITCPSGYECNIAPNDAYAVCCPSSSGQLGGGTAKPGECPAPTPGGFGICANTCSQDSDCTGDQKCCRNECGATTCQQPLSSQPFSACATVRCGAGTQCVEQQVQCIRAPCPPQASCVPIERDGVCPRPKFSWSLYWSRRRCQKDCRVDGDCPNFQKCCKDHTGCGTLCQDPEPENTCANTKCDAGQYCVMQEVQCIRAPCFPIPNCVSIENACNPACKAGSKCQLRNKACGYFGGSCGQSPQCVQQPVCQPTCGPDSECQSQRSSYCFFGYCPSQTRCVAKSRCPLYPAWINPNCVRTDECDTSNPNPCASGLLCCSTDCGRKCVRPQ